MAETETDGKACGGANPNGASTPGDGQVNALTHPDNVDPATELISDTSYYYDDPSLGPALPNDLQPGTPSHPAAIPSKGDLSETRITVYDKSAGKLVSRVQSAGAYNPYGTVTDTWDPLGDHTHIDFTVTGGVITGATTTNPLGQTSTITMDPVRAAPVSETDANGVTTTSHYDGLGRVTAVWSANRSTSSAPNAKFTYQPSNTAPTVITTQILNDSGGYKTSTALYDAMLRPIQTQQPTPRGGRLLTNTYYDTHGWTWKVNNAWWDSATTPNGTLQGVDDAKVPNQTVTNFDGMGRPILTTSYYQSQPREQTATAYYGDKTITIPPQGGVAHQTLTDTLGRTTEIDDFTTRPTYTVNTSGGSAPITTVTVSGGSTQATADGKTQGVAYAFDVRGDQTSVTNLASGDVWRTSYNTLGQLTGKSDPDAGTSSMVYDLAGRLAQTTDGGGNTLSFSYDALGRKIGEFHGAVPDPAQQIASFTYDNRNPDGSTAVSGLTNPIGHLTSATRYDASGNTTVGGLTGAQRGYTKQVNGGFNVFGEPQSTSVTIPASEGAIAGTYTFDHYYTDTLGLPDSDHLPASPGGGALPDETVIHGYSGPLDLPASLSGNDSYATDTSYTAYGQVAQTTVGSTVNSAFLTATYDPHTAALTDSQLTNSNVSSTPIDETSYHYDLAGNPLSQTNIRQGTTTETQCYGYDTLDRLTQAWTATDGCKADPSTNSGSTVGSGVSGGAYWTSWQLDPLGQRQAQTEHGLGGTPDKTTTYTYGYTSGGVTQPHTLASTSTTVAGSSSPATTTSYAYNPIGSLTGRTTVTNPGAPNQTTSQQTYTWSDTGQLTSATIGQPSSPNAQQKPKPSAEPSRTATPGTTSTTPAPDAASSTPAPKATKARPAPKAAKASPTPTPAAHTGPSRHGTAQHVTKPADTSNSGPTYTYDANGQLLLQKDPTTTSTTLYLPGEQLVLNTTSGAITGTRYYPLPGGIQAIRVGASGGSSVAFQMGDLHGTASFTIDQTLTKPTWRQQTPYGAPRGAAPDTSLWPNDQRGFLGKIQSASTGLTNLGARWYDPTLGRFISLDPIFEATDQQQQNGYTYSASNPITGSDPSGLMYPGNTGEPMQVPGYTPPADPPSGGGGGGDDNGGGGGIGVGSCFVVCAELSKMIHRGEHFAWQHAKNIFNATVDGSVQSVVDLGSPLINSLVGSARALTCAGMGPYAAGCRSDYTAPGDPNVHIPLGGDTKSPEYKPVKKVAEVITPMLIPDDEGVPAINGIRALARVVPRLLQRVGAKEASKAAEEIPRVVEELPHGSDSTPAPANCFPAGTKVATDHGTKPIEKIKVGDRVWSRDPATGKTSLQKVLRLYRHKATNLVTFQAGRAKVRVTPDHRIWVVGQGWTLARNLHRGDHLLTLNGRSFTLTSVTALALPTTVYNFEVAHTHTYYVEAGNTPVLVHNECGPGPSQVHTRTWVAGRPLADDTPQDWIPMNTWIRSGGNLSPGNHTFVVMPGGSVRAFHESLWDIAEGAGHTSLSRGRPVIMAGTLDVDASGGISAFDNFSGHYRPGGPGLEAIARDALSRNGFDVSGATWNPFNFGQ